MNTADFTNKVIADMELFFAGEDKSYDTPETSYAKCAEATLFTMQRWDYSPRTHVAYAEVQDLSENQILNMSYCSNHYAVVIDETTVIDFTFRQFAPDASYPAVMPYDEWVAALGACWNDPLPFDAIGDYICGECLMGVNDNCECEYIADEVSDYETEHIPL